VTGVSGGAPAATPLTSTARGSANLGLCRAEVDRRRRVAAPDLGAHHQGMSQTSPNDPERPSPETAGQPVALSVMLAVPDAQAAARSYQDALGATTMWDLGSVVGLRIGAAPLIIGEPAANGWSTPGDASTTTVRVELFAPDPDSVLARAVGAGAVSHHDVSDHRMPWGIHRQGGFVDPFGHVWFVGDHSPLR